MTYHCKLWQSCLHFRILVRKSCRTFLPSSAPTPELGLARREGGDHLAELYPLHRCIKSDLWTFMTCSHGDLSLSAPASILSFDHSFQQQSLHRGIDKGLHSGGQESLLVERHTRDRKVVSSSPSRSSRRIFFSGVNFLC